MEFLDAHFCVTSLPLEFPSLTLCPVRFALPLTCRKGVRIVGIYSACKGIGWRGGGGLDSGGFRTSRRSALPDWVIGR